MSHALERLPVGETPFERAKRVIAEQPDDLTLEQVKAQRDLWIISASEWCATIERLSAELERVKGAARDARQFCDTEDEPLERLRSVRIAIDAALTTVENS